MNKSDLISTVAGHTGMPQRDVAKSLDGIVSAITAALKQGGDVRLTGFGTFTVAERAASTGRNPAPVSRSCYRRPNRPGLRLEARSSQRSTSRRGLFRRWVRRTEPTEPNIVS